MNKSLVRCLTAVLSVAAMGAVVAAPNTTQVVEVKSESLRKVFSWEAERIAGEYLLSDGRMLAVWQQGLAVMARIDGEAPVHLRALNANEMHDGDGHMQLRFDTVSQNDAVLVTVSLRQDSGATKQIASLARRPQ